MEPKRLPSRVIESNVRACSLSKERRFSAMERSSERTSDLRSQVDCGSGRSGVKGQDERQRTAPLTPPRPQKGFFAPRPGKGGLTKNDAVIQGAKARVGFTATYGTTKVVPFQSIASTVILPQLVKSCLPQAGELPFSVYILRASASKTAVRESRTRRLQRGRWLRGMPDALQRECGLPASARRPSPAREWRVAG